MGKKILKNTLFILFLVILRASVFGNYTVPTGSMNPTILEGDKFFSNQVAYSFRLPLTKIHPIRWAIPEHGDIIAFIYPKDESQTFTKRVIGLPGDVIIYKDQKLYVNGKCVTRQIINRDKNYNFSLEKLYDTTYTVQHQLHHFSDEIPRTFKVPPHSLFVMGDNRDNSSDSRYWGFVPIENVIGKIVFRWLSINPNNNDIRFSRIGFVE